MEERLGNHQLGAAEDSQAMADALRNLQTLQRLELRTSNPVTSQEQLLGERQCL